MKINVNMVPTVSLAGVTLPTSTAKIMSGNCTVNNYDTLKHKGAPYQVPAGKTLRIWATRIFVDSSTNGAVSLGYGDTAVANAGAPTNYVSIAFGTASSAIGFAGTTIYSSNEFVMYAEIPAGKYPFMFANLIQMGAIFLCEEV